MSFTLKKIVTSNDDLCDIFSSLDISTEKKKANKWFRLFKRNPFGKCMICENKIRANEYVLKINRIKFFKQKNFPPAFWIKDDKYGITPICYCCASLGTNIEEITMKKNEHTHIPSSNIHYISNWYKTKSLCNYVKSDTNVSKLCGKQVFQDGYCLEHCELFYEGRINFKKCKKH
jgi:hypothetical protein